MDKLEINGAEITDEIRKRFFALIEVRGDDDCWYWKGCRDYAGYGQYTIQTKPFRVRLLSHQISLVLSGVKRSRGEHVLHSRQCTLNAIEDFGDHEVSRLCCNPKHLRIGTPKENAQDKMAVGTARCLFKKGMKPFITMKKLSDEDVRKIRADTRKQKEIAMEYGIDQANISRIKKFKQWAGVL